MERITITDNSVRTCTVRLVDDVAVVRINRDFAATPAAEAAVQAGIAAGVISSANRAAVITTRR